jgi:hypothetical protein
VTEKFVFKFEKRRNDSLYLDSGVTHHVVHSKELLRDIYKLSVSTVVLGRGEEPCVERVLLC